MGGEEAEEPEVVGRASLLLESPRLGFALRSSRAGRDGLNLPTALQREEERAEGTTQRPSDRKTAREKTAGQVPCGHARVAGRLRPSWAFRYPLVASAHGGHQPLGWPLGSRLTPEGQPPRSTP